VEGAFYGHLSHHDVTFMDVLSATGALLLSALKEVHLRGERGGEIDRHIQEISHTLQALQVLQCSYEMNPSNEELDSISTSAA